MTIQLAKRMQGLRASEIREILKVTQQPGVISFAGGLPAAELFPASDLMWITLELLKEQGGRALQYSPTEGIAGLRTAIAGRMNDRLGTRVTADEIVITSGSQQGLDLSGKLLLDEGDVVLCESPTYLGAINAFQCYRPRFVEVKTDNEGMVIADLERCLEKHQRIKLVYVIPDFQNPTGRRWSLERRRAFVRVIARYDIPIIEDCPYGELGFDGRTLPPIKAIADPDRVIFLGTFSKIFCPGLRLGWVAAERGLLRKYVLAKQGADLHSSTLAQMQAQAYLSRYDIDRAIERLRGVYGERRDVMLRAMDEEFPDEVRYTRPDGGVFLWVELPESANARDLLERCIEEKVAFVPGGSFFPNGGHENTFRLNYSAMPPARITEGIRRIGRVLCDGGGRRRTTRAA